MAAPLATLAGMNEFWRSTLDRLATASQRIRLVNKKSKKQYI